MLAVTHTVRPSLLAELTADCNALAVVTLVSQPAGAGVGVGIGVDVGVGLGLGVGVGVGLGVDVGVGLGIGVGVGVGVPELVVNVSIVWVCRPALSVSVSQTYLVSAFWNVNFSTGQAMVGQEDWLPVFGPFSGHEGASSGSLGSRSSSHL